MTVIPFPRKRRVPAWLLEIGLAMLAGFAVFAIVTAILLAGVLP